MLNTNTSTAVHQTDMEIDKQSMNPSQYELTNSSFLTNPTSWADEKYFPSDQAK
ncbi:9000_t:CDS:2 [Acaulospora morrowiae]|uniref:9000_t:CDS:1 n=1 Tax=Acaulospora morrowiae TaxID=94023 RepID=A0A9N8WBQ3_9GLOM|nr:9000_t:CDS:2 [Acaulospora morrowiae]